MFRDPSNVPRYPLPISDKPPADPAERAEDFSHRYAFPLDQYRAIRIQELKIPEPLQGAPDFGGDGTWRAFIARERSGGNITTGITVKSGVLNPDRLKGMKGGRLWPKAHLRDRIDAVIAREYEEGPARHTQGIIEARAEHRVAGQR